MSATDSERARKSGRIHLGTSGRVPSERVADLRWNQWPAWVGIRRLDVKPKIHDIRFFDDVILTFQPE